jgi:hypothetical protein
MIDHLHLQDLVLSHLYLLNGADLGRAASDAEKQLRAASILIPLATLEVTV